MRSSSLLATISLYLFATLSAASPLISRGSSPTPIGSLDEMLPIPDNWDSASDFLIAEPAYARALTGSYTWLGNNQAAPCIAKCQEGGWPIAGLEYTNECWCGSELSNGANLRTYSYSSPTYCPIGRDAQERDSPQCGSAGGLNIFYDTSVLNADLSPKSTGSPSSVCLAETGSGSGRLFNGASFYDDLMSGQKCIAFCQSKGFNQAGVEYARECYCGKNVNFSTAAKSTACTMTCPGNRLEKCGGGNAINAYQL